MTAELIALTEELRRTTEMLGTVLARLDAADRRANRHRAWTILLAVTVGAVSALGGLFWIDQQQEREAACLRANATKADIRDAIVSTVELVVADTSDPASLRPLVERIEADLLKRLPDRPC